MGFIIATDWKNYAFETFFFSFLSVRRLWSWRRKKNARMSLIQIALDGWELYKSMLSLIIPSLGFLSHPPDVI